MSVVHIIGAGMAGSEAAWQIAKRGIKVIIHEMRGTENKTDAHHTDKCAELVCSNSFRSDNPESGIGLLHEEMRKLDSLILKTADLHKVPAGDALAVDREAFSNAITETLNKNPNIEIRRELIEELPPASWGEVIIATGPLTHTKLANSILQHSGIEHLAFFDAIAPIVHKESIDFSKAWFQSRYDKGEGKDYINCPMTKEQYYNFIEKLLAAPKTEFKEWEKNTPYFEGCLPIEVMAERGIETLAFLPMKPVGLTPPDGSRPYAVVQLRQDNKLGTLYNIVGFQTKLTYGSQKEIFRLIPGLENAEFARLGGIHRNTFINSPKLLDNKLRLKSMPHIKIAGQVSGVEGYVESAAMGLLAGIFNSIHNISPPPVTTALGALLNHITGGHIESGTGSFQPMNINFGLFPQFESVKPIRGKKNRKAAHTERARADLSIWMSDNF